MTFTNINGNIEVVRSTDGGKTWSVPSLVTPQIRGHTIEVNGGPAYDARRHAVLAPSGRLLPRWRVRERVDAADLGSMPSSSGLIR